MPSAIPGGYWIPGGMFEFHATGATPFHDGSRFARDGIVCVTISYRVGAEGFLFLTDAIANLGLLDQIAALKWVQENIAAFGGNPDKVTIFGESAGAMSVATLLTMPRAKGLFHRAIVQSGNTPNVNSAATAKRIGGRLSEILDVEATRETIAATSVLAHPSCSNGRRPCNDGPGLHLHMYEFAWRSPQFGGRLGAAHSVEIPFVFDTLGGTQPLLGPDPPQSLATMMHAAWVAFATSGDCGWPKALLVSSVHSRARCYDPSSEPPPEPLFLGPMERGRHLALQ
jgi:carboxylesterase type B